MSVMILLLGASLLVGIIFLIAFIWSVRDGQFEDDQSPAHKILYDDTIVPLDEEQDDKAQINHL